MPISVDQRILNGGHLLIQADLVLFGILAPNKPSLVRGFFGFSGHVAGWFTNATALDAIPPNLLQQRPTAINEDGRLSNLLRGKNFLVRIHFFSLLGRFSITGCFGSLALTSSDVRMC